MRSGRHVPGGINTFLAVFSGGNFEAFHFQNGLDVPAHDRLIFDDQDVLHDLAFLFRRCGRRCFLLALR